MFYYAILNFKNIIFIDRIALVIIIFTLSLGGFSITITTNKNLSR